MKFELFCTCPLQHLRVRSGRSRTDCRPSRCRRTSPSMKHDRIHWIMWIMYVSMYTANHTKKCTNFQVRYMLSVPVRVLCNYVKRHHPCYDERLTLFCDQGAAQSLEQRYKRTFAVHVRSCSGFNRWRMIDSLPIV